MSALVTSLGVFTSDRERRRFRLKSIHPGHTLEEILDNTGVEFDPPAGCEITRTPQMTELELIRSEVQRQVAEIYPRFAAQL